MNRLTAVLASLLITAGGAVSARAQSWEGIHHVTVEEAAANFATPPADFASHVIWGWEGPMDIETIRHDLDSIKTKGFRSVIFEAGYHLPFEYLSDDWFKTVRRAVREAKKRDLKVWIIDEGKYPSGFAGGKFTKERPDLRMQALIPVDTVSVAAGESVTGLKLDPRAISAIALSRSGEPSRTVPVINGTISFKAGDGDWDILVAGLGFRGDEPDFAYTPWTPDMVREFKDRKGYDPTPMLASLLAPVRSVAEERFRADYWDVWSELFAVNFFGQQAEWCAENGLAYITHLNNDHNMPVCIRAEGSLFRDLSKVQVPGVDAIWNQIWPGTVNDFPKFASSVSQESSARVSRPTTPRPASPRPNMPSTTRWCAASTSSNSCSGWQGPGTATG